jgi:hypothetical protein
MSSVVISGDTSGTVTLQAPAVAGTNTITLPAGTGTAALTSDIPGTTLYAIGSYVTGRPANVTAYASNTTIAGSSLYATGGVITYSTAYSGWAIPGQGPCDANAYVLVNTGTWRCLAPAGTGVSYGAAGLWVRIS